MSTIAQHRKLGCIPNDWPVTRLDELLEFRNGLNADKEAYGTGIPFINVLEAITYSHLKASQIPGRVAVSDEDARSYSVRQSDLLFNRTSETQEELALAAVYEDTEPVIFGGFVIRGRPKTNRLDPAYSGYALRAREVRVQITAKGQGAIRANIGQGDLRQVLVPVPSLPEQRAIAAALSDADAIIAALDNLIAKKRAIRQGAMQQLLTGRSRMSGFDREWKTARLGALAEVESGGTPRSTVARYYGGGIPWVSITDITASGKYL